MEENALRERVLTSEQVFDGKLIRVEHRRVALPDGREALREIVVHIGASAIVPVDAEGRVTLVTQYRVAMERLTVEIPAGKLDFRGEDPLACAKRELEEETGLRAARWQALTTLDTTPGFCTERIGLFLATELQQGDTHPDADEFLRLQRIPLCEAVQRVMRGEIRDAKTIAGLLMAARVLGV
ncbi:MAG: NUDIX hydrolase [Clostridia bacterium]